MAAIERKISDKFGVNLGVLTISNPPMNLLTKDMLDSLVAGIQNFQNDKNVQVIVITGQGLSFVAGVDIKFIYEMAQTGDRERVSQFLSELHKVFYTMTKAVKPTVAAINGYCFGGGLELALACDNIVASNGQTVQFACPEINRGIIPGLGATQRLPRRIDPKFALKMLLAGIPNGAVNGETALKVRLVDEIIKGEFIPGVADFAKRVLSGDVKRTNDHYPKEDRERPNLTEEEFREFAQGNPLYPARTIARVAIDGFSMYLYNALFQLELPALLDCLFKPDALEGLSSFLDKQRKPVFEHVVGPPLKPTSTNSAEDTAPIEK